MSHHDEWGNRELQELREMLREVLRRLKIIEDNTGPAIATGGHIVFGAPFEQGSVPPQGGNVMATMTDAQNIPVTAQFLDAKGNAVAVASVTWASSNDAIASVVPNAAPDQGAVIDSGPAGSPVGDVTITATSDDGTVLSAVLTVVAGPATQGAITFGTPVAQ